MNYFERLLARAAAVPALAGDDAGCNAPDDPFEHLAPWEPEWPSVHTDVHVQRRKAEYRQKSGQTSQVHDMANVTPAPSAPGISAQSLITAVGTRTQRADDHAPPTMDKEKQKTVHRLPPTMMESDAQPEGQRAMADAAMYLNQNDPLSVADAFMQSLALSPAAMVARDPAARQMAEVQPADPLIAIVVPSRLQPPASESVIASDGVQRPSASAPVSVSQPTPIQKTAEPDDRKPTETLQARAVIEVRPALPVTAQYALQLGVSAHFGISQL